jgi:lipoprotein-releasing system permease protein
MPYELFLAIRYLRSRHKRRLARVTALVAVLGISLGVAAFIAAVALANGFRDEMREKILRGTAHMSVMRTDGKRITDYRELSARIKTVDGVSDAMGTTYDGAVLIGPNASAYAVLRAVDGEVARAEREVKQSLVEGSTTGIFYVNEGEPPNAVIGAELATHTGLHVGDVADLVLINASLTSNQPVKRFIRVVGIFRSGLFEYDSTWIYLPLDIASTFAGAPHSASVLSVDVSDIYDVKPIAAKIRATLGESYVIVDWQEANQPLFNALALERRMALFIIALIILIAALNITTALILVVVERRTDIGILGAMGATSKSIMGIFMIEGAIIGTVGALLGIVLGSITCFIGNHYKLISLPADVYSISNVPFNAQLRDVAIAALVAFLLSLVATIYPARAAARVRPVDMLNDAE